MLDKKDISYEGVWCVADIGSPRYNELARLSNETISVASQKYYGRKLMYFCAVIITLFIMKRINYLIVDQSCKTTNSANNIAKNFYYKVSAIIRFLSYRRFPTIICNFFGLPSSYGNFLVIIGSCCYITCYTFIPKFWYRECRGFGLPPLSVRTGLMSTSLLPLSIILSGKTNIISQLTGISYEKINIYHQWVSIASCFLGWVHTIPFYIQAVKEGGRERLSYFQKNDDMFISGLLPMIFLTILTIFSHKFFRKFCYEFFIHLHWISALGLYISLFYHIRHSVDGKNYLIALIIFWFTQLLWRLFNKSFFRPNTNCFLKSNNCKLKKFISVNNENYFEILIENSNDFAWRPGQHIFIRFPELRIFDNHPFSIISSFEYRRRTSIKLIVKSMGKFGITEKIFKKLPSSGFKETRALVDGPYGGCNDRILGSFRNIYLISSGTGITAILPVLVDSIKNLRNRDSLTEFIRFDWYIKNLENIEWIIHGFNKLLRNSILFLKTSKLKINIYVKEDIGFANKSFLEALSDRDVQDQQHEEVDGNNSDNHGSEYDFEHEYGIFFKENLECEDSGASTYMEKGESEETNCGLSLINISNKRPSIDELVEEINPSLDGRNFFIVSGSESIKNLVSNRIASLQLEIFQRPEVHEIYLHTECYGW